MGDGSVHRCSVATGVRIVNLPILIWERSGPAYYATVRGPSGDVRYRMEVEPNGVFWSWTVWRPGESPGAARYGTTATAQEALRDAEQATSG
jgi:hypothetical protein